MKKTPDSKLIILIGLSKSAKEKLINCEDKRVKNELSFMVFEDERSLHKLLVKYKYFNSISQVKKNRPDLVKTLDKIDTELYIKIGKKFIIVGVASDLDSNGEQYE